jgi:hypothetical protein
MRGIIGVSFLVTCGEVWDQGALFALADRQFRSISNKIRHQYWRVIKLGELTVEFFPTGSDQRNGRSDGAGFLSRIRIML